MCMQFPRQLCYCNIDIFISTACGYVLLPACIVLLTVLMCAAIRVSFGSDPEGDSHDSCPEQVHRAHQQLALPTCTTSITDLRCHGAVQALKMFIMT